MAPISMTLSDLYEHAGKTRMIGLPYGEKLWQYVKPFSSNTGTSRTDGRTNGQNSYINIARQYADAR